MESQEDGWSRLPSPGGAAPETDSLARLGDGLDAAWIVEGGEIALSLSPSRGEGIETAPSPSERERVGVRVAHVFTHNPG